MSILAWIEDQRRLKLLNAPKYNHPASDGSKGLWTRCDHCGVILYIKHLRENQRVCFGCGYHLQMDSQERIEHLIDDNTWRPLDETLSPCDPLSFGDQKPYTERLREAQERTGLQDAVQTGTGLLDGIPIALGVMDFNFMGGSMGSVVGEKITRLIEYATQEGLTLVLVCASGGARMQEGIFSLMQMAKISGALQIYQSCANLLYISVLTSPTTGGVTASFAMLGDLIFAEPKALIGFAGRRVIEQTLQEDLPEDFQTSEYLLHHGLLDLIVPRCFLKQALSETITLYKDAPFKPVGKVPYGLQNGLNLLTEEKVRRRWQDWSLSLYGDASTTNSPLEAPPSFAEWQSAADEPPKLGGGLPEFLELRLSQPTRESECEDPSLATAFTSWLTDPSSDQPYREILLSFQAMFSLFTNPPGLPSGADAPRPSGEDVLQPDLSNATSLQRAIALPSHKGPQEDGVRGITPDLIDLAFEVSDKEAIGWRAFYTTHKVSPKLALFSHLNSSKGSGTGKENPAQSPPSTTAATPPTSGTTQQNHATSQEVEGLGSRSDEWTSNQVKRFDKQFLYSMLIKRATPDSDLATSLLPPEQGVDG
jgi:acetyl-CoA carboxylase carboxyl transferase subunit beta